MKTNAKFVLAALLAAALPTVAFAQSSGNASLGSLENGDVESENLRLHTVQRKEVSDHGRHEVVLYPAIVQLNPKFTTHVGAGLQYLYHLHENFALQVQGNYFYISEQTSFSDELVRQASQSATAASALTLQWATTAGFEVTPIYGKFAYYEGNMASFGLVLTGGAGIGQTQVQLLSENQAGGPTFGDTGMKFVGQLGAGFRVRFNENFVVRLQVNDLVYTARVDKINGCNYADLAASACSSLKDANETVARELLRDISSDVLNNIGVYGGVAYTF